jgi:hypothetical protein
VVISDVRCPRCQRSIDTYFGLTTALGPATVRCAGCRAVVGTGRAEWPSFSKEQKVRYVVLSLLGVCVYGCIGGIGVRGAVHFTDAGPFQEQMTLDGPGLRAGIMAWALAVVALQWVRVRLSLRRAARSPAEAPRSSGLLNFTLGLQLTLMGAAFLVPFVSWGVSYLRLR